MYCKVCGNNEDDQNNVCSCCGSSLKSDICALYADNDPHIVNSDQYSTDSKPRCMPLILCMSIVAGMLIILACMPGFRKMIVRNISTPAGLMERVYCQSVASIVSKVHSIDNTSHSGGIAAEYCADIQIGDTMLSMLAEEMGINAADICGLQDFQIICDAAYDENLLVAQYSLEQDGDRILSMEHYADKSALRQWIVLPDLTDQPLVIDVAKPEEFLALFDHNDTLLDIDPKLLSEISIKYTKMLVGSFENVNKHFDKVTCNGLSQRVTVLRAAISTDKFYTTLIEMIDVASNDPEIASFFYQEDGQIQKAFYEDYVQSLNRQRMVLEDLIQQSDDYGSFVLSTYLNNKNEIVGVDLAYTQNGVSYSMFSFVVVRDGLRYSMQISFQDEYFILGTGSVAAGLEGNFSFCYTDQKICEISIKDFQYSSEKASGSIVMIPSEEIIEHLMDEAGMYDSYLNANRLPDFSVAMIFDCDPDHYSAMVSVSAEQELVKVSISCIPKDDIAIKLPEKVNDVADISDFEQWYSEMDDISISELLSRFEDAGIHLDNIDSKEITQEVE